MYIGIDTDKLRCDLIDYYGTAMSAGFTVAIMDLSKVERASDEELIKLAEKAKIDLNEYLR